MSESSMFSAVTRTGLGRRYARRVRQERQVPGIVYGGVGQSPTPIEFTQRDILRALESESFISQVVKISLDGKPEDVLLKAVQRHPFKNLITHVDFMRVTPETVVTSAIPVHFLNEEKCQGVRLQGGVITKNLSDVLLRAKVADLPEAIVVDLEPFGIGHVVHLSDLSLPDRVRPVALLQGHDLAVVQVSAFKESLESDASAAAATAPEGAESAS